VQGGGRRAAGDRARQRVLAGLPVTERRRRLAGVSTAVLEGGDGPDMVLLHGQGGWAAGWLPVIPDLVRTHHVVVPDLPGLGASETPEGPPDPGTVLAWLGELIEQTCAAPPVLVGASLGGSIAARFAAGHGERVSRLVLVDTGCLVGRVRPAPGVLLALVRHSLRPSRPTMVRFLRQVTVDLDRVRRRLGERWEPFLVYSLDRARTPGVQQANRRLLRDLGWRQIPPEGLARIDVPTALIWGRQDRVMPVGTAQRASARYGWPLHVIDDAGHFLVADQPEAFLGALHAALGTADHRPTADVQQRGTPGSPAAHPRPPRHPQTPDDATRPASGMSC
jgi:pimeloyl-ACP methyl ester carboxylesterase